MFGALDGCWFDDHKVHGVSCPNSSQTWYQKLMITRFTMQVVQIAPNLHLKQQQLQRCTLQQIRCAGAVIRLAFVANLNEYVRKDYVVPRTWCDILLKVRLWWRCLSPFIEGCAQCRHSCWQRIYATDKLCSVRTSGVHCNRELLPCACLWSISRKYCSQRGVSTCKVQHFCAFLRHYDNQLWSDECLTPVQGILQTENGFETPSSAFLFIGECIACWRGASGCCTMTAWLWISTKHFQGNSTRTCSMPLLGCWWPRMQEWGMWGPGTRYVKVLFFLRAKTFPVCFVCACVQMFKSVVCELCRSDQCRCPSHSNFICCKCLCPSTHRVYGTTLPLDCCVVCTRNPLPSMQVNGKYHSLIALFYCVIPLSHSSKKTRLKSVSHKEIQSLTCGLLSFCHSFVLS